MQIDEIAKVCHEANRAYCAALGDTSHLPWEDAPTWQRESAIAGVRAHMYGGGLSAEESHAAWLKLKYEQGWSYGPTKDPTLKLHPCCVPYDQLPPYEKAKDYIFGAIVKAIHSIDGEKVGDGVAGDRKH